MAGQNTLKDKLFSSFTDKIIAGIIVGVVAIVTLQVGLVSLTRQVEAIEKNIEILDAQKADKELMVEVLTPIKEDIKEIKDMLRVK